MGRWWTSLVCSPTPRPCSERRIAPCFKHKKHRNMYSTESVISFQHITASMELHLLNSMARHSKKSQKKKEKVHDLSVEQRRENNTKNLQWVQVAVLIHPKISGDDAKIFLWAVQTDKDQEWTHAMAHHTQQWFYFYTFKKSIRQRRLRQRVQPSCSFELFNCHCLTWILLDLLRKKLLEGIKDSCVGNHNRGTNLNFFLTF